uniref:Guanyl nucleotide exchange factor Sql2 n=1 Tax=Ganoderma boninense TaxID=34458 RepID=A0A5K1JSI3_9APHY|nr:Guanyl nucleotide exchange factor Sql2 [Ganoderma boninense]
MHATLADNMHDPQSSMNYDEPQAGDELLSTFFCRALYNYQSEDPSSLSFKTGDVIEVLTRLESGWWDGLLNDERGWFPSNYVTVISDQEAEAAFGASEYPSTHAALPDDSIVDMVHTMSQALSQSDPDGDWLNGGGADYQDALQSLGSTNGSARGVPGGGMQHSDFWVPQVGQDGRIFYVNTHTGQQSADLPAEGEVDEDSAVAALAPQPSSRTGPATAYGLAASNSREGAGFGIPQRLRTPEPWVRRLADDGQSYYYVNRLDGKVSWTLPESATPPSYSQDDYSGPLASKNPTATSSSTIPNAAIPSSTPLNGSVNGITRPRVDSSHSQTQAPNGSSTDIHSDDSDTFFSSRRDGPTAPAGSATGDVGRPSASRPLRPLPSIAAALEPTAAEKSAKALQSALSPSSPETVVELSDRTRDAVAAVLRYLQGSFSPRHREQYREVDVLVLEVVTAVRNLLYVTATPSGHVPSHLYPRDPRDPRPGGRQTLQAHLKAAHRKVAGTLSKLVLSTLALQYDPGLSSTDKPNRMESDVLELERAITAFVQEVVFFQEQHALSSTLSRTPGGKRLLGTFSTANIGLGLPGAGFAGDWRGFGFALPDDDTEVPERMLSDDVVIEYKGSLKALEARLGSLVISLRYLDSHPERVSQEGQSASAYLSWLLQWLCGINVAYHVDVDGVRSDSSPQYRQMVDRARNLVRTLEAATQALYDDGATLFMAAQHLSFSEFFARRDRTSLVTSVEITAPAIRANCVLVAQTLESLLALGHDQASTSQGDYRNSIEWRTSRINIADSSLTTISQLAENNDDDLVDMEHAFGQPTMRTVQTEESGGSTLYSSANQPSQTSLDMSQRSRNDSVSDAGTSSFGDTTFNGPPSPEFPSPLDEDVVAYLDEDDPVLMGKSPSRRGKGNKLMKILGSEAPRHYISELNADQKPWYLRMNNDQTQILIDPDGHVRAGTAAALVERLTLISNRIIDTKYTRNFLMTFKSFMTVDELFELLTNRYWISPPPNLKRAELEEWTRLKQQIVRTRVLNVFRTLVTDDDVLEREDMYILARMKEFASNEEVVTSPAARQLLVVIERAQRSGDAPIKTTNTTPVAPPAPIVPKTSKKLKLLDIDPLEVARQLTLMEAALYKKIRPMECLQRSRESKLKSADNITVIIQLSNKIADWVAETVLDREDSQKRARVVKHFINVADRCRTLQNFSSMTAIVSGLNRPPIRRLKRTWEQVNAKFMSQLQICESTVDTNKNFNNYRSMLARVQPPCVPFIGVYLTTLTFINDGADDKLAGNMINFRKRQKAAEVIQDIKRWQAVPFNFQTVASVLSYLEDSFQAYHDGVDYGDQFWNLSLEREPREREDEKMARLLQESGFL